jgi:hypothetical protein
LFKIRQALSLNITELAGILRVARPALYAWIQGRSQPHKNNWKRIDDVYELALDWRQMSVEPTGDLSKSRFGAQGSFVGALRENHLNSAQLHGMMLGMKAELVRRAPVEADAMIALLSSDRGYAPVPEEVQQENFKNGTEW